MRNRREFTAEFKREAVRLASEEGMTFAQVARDLGVGANLVSRWKQRFAEEGERAFPGRGNPRDEEIALLKRELGRVKRERAFLREAAAFFAKDTK